MNIVKLQNELKGVPDDALINYVQNPTGQVPSYLALSELQRRKEMRANYEKQKAPETTVADDVKQQSQPSGLAMLAKNPAQGNPTMSSAPTEPGVAGLPVPDQMFSGQGMAAGGIVAFADGGQADADSLNLDVQPTLNVNTGESTYGIPDNMNINQWIAYGGLRGAVADQARRGVNDAKALNWMFGLGQKGNTMYDQFANQARSRFAEGGHVPSFAGVTDGSYISPNFYTASPDQSSAMADVQAKIEEGKRQAAKIAIQKSQQGIPLTMDEKALLQERGVVNAMSGATAATPVDLPSAPTVNKKPMLDTTQNIATQDKTTQQKPINPFEGYPGSYTPEKVRSISDYGKDFADYLGVDPMKQQLADRLAKMEKGATEQERIAPWMALAQAGFGMAAGKSPYALQNIAEGATAGLKAYGESKEKMAALEEKRFSLLNDIAKADRAEKIAIGKYGADSKQAVEERNFKEKLQDKHDKVLFQINREDNLAVLNKAAAGKQPTVTENLKAIEYINEHLPAKEKEILAELGGNAKNEGSDNHTKYLQRMEKARQDLRLQALTGNPSAGTAATPVVNATYVPGKGFINQ